jgi:hypothetical protein
MMFLQQKEHLQIQKPSQNLDKNSNLVLINVMDLGLMKKLFVKPNVFVQNIAQKHYLTKKMLPSDF